MFKAPGFGLGPFFYDCKISVDGVADMWCCLCIEAMEMEMIQYRQDVVNFFKKAGFAISEIEEVKFGVTYFSNSFREGEDGFEIVRLLTDKEHWSAWCASLGRSEESMFTHSDDIAWFEIRTNDGLKWHSLTDCNVGASYNPWLIFKTKQSLDAYEKLQVITYSRDELDDWFDGEYDYEEA